MPRVLPFPALEPASAAQALAAEVLDAETAGLIADFGQPHWPFWRWLMALLLLAQLAVLAQQATGAEIEQIRARAANRRPPIERVQRPGRTVGQNRTGRAPAPGGAPSHAARRAAF